MTKPRILVTSATGHTGAPAVKPGPVSKQLAELAVGGIQISKAQKDSARVA
jgi:hypothetical protein